MSATAAPYGFTFLPEPDPVHDPAPKALSGFWLFMMSDLVLFALVFATYVTMLMPVSFAHGPTPKQLFELPGTALETAVLLTSTFTFALGSLAIQYERGRAQVLLWLGVTLALGVSFLALEGHEFAGLFAEGAVPQRSGFLSAFFALVPLHGLHVLVGSIWLALMLWEIARSGMCDLTRSRLARLALFWHFLDLIWVGIFSLVYLAGRA